MSTKTNVWIFGSKDDTTNSSITLPDSLLKSNEPPTGAQSLSDKLKLLLADHEELRNLKGSAAVEAADILDKLITELTLSSTPHEHSPSARELLEVVAFFPQGVDENNLDWLFPTISDRRNIFDKFCVLSLTYRSNGFITMLAPIREHLTPKDPKSSPLLCATRDRYLTRLTVFVDPVAPGFEEARWIASEDVNVEHLLDIFTSADTNSGGVWVACIHFLQHLCWHKPRQTVLKSKIEGLFDAHPSKPDCLFGLSRLFEQVGNWAGYKRLLTQTLEIEFQRGDGSRIARALRFLSEANRYLGIHEEGIRQAEAALEILERLGD